MAGCINTDLRKSHHRVDDHSQKTERSNAQFAQVSLYQVPKNLQHEFSKFSCYCQGWTNISGHTESVGIQIDR